VIYLIELDAYDPALPGLRVLRYSSGIGYVGELASWDTTARTNVVLQSNTLTSTPWAGTGASTASATSTAAPTGGTGAYASVSWANGQWSQTASVPEGGTYAASVYARRGNQPWAVLEVSATGASTGGRALFFNFDTGELRFSAGASGAAEAIGGGAYRLSLTWADDGAPADAALAEWAAGLIPLGGTALYWGAQLEAASAPTPLIPTTTAPASASGTTLDPISGTAAESFFDPRIIEPGNFARAMFAPGTTGGQSTVGAGEIVLANPDGALDSLLDYGVDGRQVRIYTVPDDSTPYSSAVRWATATAQQVEVSWERVTIRLRDRLELLNVPLQTTTYAGTTISGGLNSAEGQPEDLRDRPKPLLFGEVYNVPAVLANAYDLIYQLHDGALASIDAVYDAGAPLLFSANHASITALRTATIQGGYYATCLSAGLFRIGASPFGGITADATEGATLADRTAAQVARRIITRSALTTGDLDLATFTALDTDNAAPVGIWLPDPVTVLDASNAVLGSVGGWLLPTRLGVFEAGRLEAPAAPTAATFTTEEVLERGGGIERIASGDRGAGVPVWRVTVRYRRHYAVQGSTEVAGCVASARRAELAQEWRSVKAENGAIKTKHLLATELVVDTCLSDAADAQAEAARLLALYSVRRDRLIVPVDTDLAAAVDLGRTVSIQVDRWGYGAGRLMTVLGLAEQAALGVTELDVWG
jgi:hypothetical protein